MVDPDSFKMNKFAVNGKKDEKGELIEGASLKKLIKNLPDFKSEMTMLQYRAEQLGVQIDCSPKYYPEIAGKAIEYCWAAAKNDYRRKRLQDKKRRESWMQLVRNSTCNKTVIKIESVRLFGRRMRNYMLAYLGIEMAKLQQTDVTLQQFPELNLSVPEMSLQLVERLVKVYKSPHKCHRSVLDTEKQFLDHVVDMMKRDETIAES